MLWNGGWSAVLVTKYLYADGDSQFSLMAIMWTIICRRKIERSVWIGFTAVCNNSWKLYYQMHHSNPAQSPYRLLNSWDLMILSNSLLLEYLSTYPQALYFHMSLRSITLHAIEIEGTLIFSRTKGPPAHSSFEVSDQILWVSRDQRSGKLAEEAVMSILLLLITFANPRNRFINTWIFLIESITSQGLTLKWHRLSSFF